MLRILTFATVMTFFMGCAFPKSEASETDINRILTQFQKLRYNFSQTGGTNKKLFFEAAKNFNITNEAARTGLKKFHPKVFKTIFKD